MPDCATASSAAISASRPASAGEVRGSTGTKSTVPAMRVFSPSVEKRLIARMPDLPAVSFCQLSLLPAPSGVTTPMPVTTTTGRPDLSRNDAMRDSRHSLLARVRHSVDRFDEREAFASPVPDAGHDHLPERAVHRLLEPR